MIMIGLLWHSATSNNLGVGALTESQISIIGKAALRAGVQVQYRVFGTNGSKDYFAHDANIVRGATISFRRILLGMSDFPSEIRKCDLVFDIGEGDSFTDIYSGARFRVQILTKLSVLFARIPLILSPQTIGPFEKRIHRSIANAVMRRCTRIFARDGLSFDYLRANKLLALADEVVDVAFRLPFQSQKMPSEKIKVGINVSGLLYNGGYTGKNQFGLTINYPRLTRALLERLTQRPDCEVWLVPHVITDSFPEEDDFKVSQALIALHPTVHLAPKFGSPSEAKSFISGMDFFIGARMHACIAAFSSGVAVVPLAYSRKFNGLFGALEYPYLGDCKAATEEQILTLIMRSLDARADLKTAVERGNRIADMKLARYELFVERTLKELRAKKMLD